MSAVGRPTRRIDWEAHTTGAAAFTGDLDFPDLLVARFLRSPHPHARILSVDTSEAAAAPGVAAVLTAADFPDRLRYIHHGPPLADRRPLAKDKVRFVGEEVAAVAAETREQANAALSMIRVRYRPLRAVTQPREALRKGAPLIHDASPGNLAVVSQRSYGQRTDDPDRMVVKGEYYFARQTHVCMETNRTVARWDPDGEVLEMWTSTQVPYFIRKEVAHALGLEREQVKVHEVAVGGGFGSKSKISEHEVLVAALAMKAPGRAVGVFYDREEEFSATKPRHDFRISLETEVEAGGRLVGHRARMIVDNGAYNHYGPSVMGVGSSTIASLYPTEYTEIEAELVYTNKHPGGQFRGYGAPQATFAVECQMDEVAEALGLDPIDLRIRNARRSGSVTHAGWKIRSAHLVECLETLREISGWDEKRSLGGSGRGIGVAVAMHVSGSHAYEGAEKSEATVTVDADGRVIVGFGGADAGTGQRTILAQVAAEELGLSAEKVDVVMMESDQTPTDMGSWSSRGTFMGGHATREAAQRAASELKQLAAEKLGAQPSKVRLEEGHAVADDKSIALGDLVLLSDRTEDDQLPFQGAYTSDTELVDSEGAPRNISAAYAFAAQAAEVEVDVATGKVRVLNVYAVHDSGRPINPIDYEGQVVGGVVMGLGAALGEELIYEGGRVVNPAYINYAMPRAADVPNVRVAPIDRVDPTGPYGAKGIGEISLNPTPAAVANAVSHAVGVRIRDLPITPDKVLNTLLHQRGPKRSYRLWRRPDRWWIALLRWLYPRGVHAILHRFGTRLARRKTSGSMERLWRPADLGQALDLLAQERGARPIGGGTDLLPASAQGLAQPVALVDVTTVREMKEIVEQPEGDLSLGGAVSLAELERSPSVDPVLRSTVQTIASPQIREMATVAGNLCQEKRCWFYRNGFSCYKRGGVTCPCYAVLGDHRFYHAAMGAHRCQAVTPSDLATTLLALDATVEVEGPKGRRQVDVRGLYSGPGETVLEPAELIVRVTVPAKARHRISRFEKLNLWEGDFAVVSVATSLALEGDEVREARVVLGAMAPIPYRAKASEMSLIGSSLEEKAIREAAQTWVSEAHPLAHNEWKVDAAVGLLQRCLLSTREHLRNRR